MAAYKRYWVLVVKKVIGIARVLNREIPDELYSKIEGLLISNKIFFNILQI